MIMERRTLVYKRTHNGDPDAQGRFGCHDCMGRVRGWQFHAVIGVGGQSREAKQNEIAGKVNWIGIGPRWRTVSGLRGPLVTFDHFLYFGVDGPELSVEAPILAQRLYSEKPRVAMKFSPEEQTEIDRLLALAEGEPPSRARRAKKLPKIQRGCPPRRC